LSICAAYAVAAAVTLYVGAIGFYWSTRFQRSIAAIPAAGVSIAAITFAIPVWLDMETNVAATLSPLAAMSSVHNSSRLVIFTLECPFWVPVVAVTGLIGAALIRAAIIRLHFVPERRYVAFRFLFLLVLLVFMTLIAGTVFKPIENPRYDNSISTFIGIMIAGVTMLLPWLGASHGVAGSDNRSRAARRYSARVLDARRTMLSASWFFTFLAVGLGVLIGIGYWIASSGFPRMSPVVWMSSVGVVFLSGQTWIALSRRFTRRRTTRGRWIALVLTYLLVGAVTVVPLILKEAMGNPETGVAPPAIQFLSLLSPGCAVERVAVHATLGRFVPAVRAVLGPVDPICVPLAVYALALVVLKLTGRSKREVTAALL